MQDPLDTTVPPLMYSYDENVYGIGGMDEKELAT